MAVCISVQMLITLLPYYYNGSVTACVYICLNAYYLITISRMAVCISV